VSPTDIAKRLTLRQREVIMNTSPIEEHRAVWFSGNAANALSASHRPGGALLERTLTANGRVAWYRLNQLGREVRECILKDGEA
jgi:hypothetical protein